MSLNSFEFREKRYSERQHFTCGVNEIAFTHHLETILRVERKIILAKPVCYVKKQTIFTRILEKKSYDK
jgi:hypothetical protein